MAWTAEEVNELGDMANLLLANVKVTHMALRRAEHLKGYGLSHIPGLLDQLAADRDRLMEGVKAWGVATEEYYLETGKEP